MPRIFYYDDGPILQGELGRFQNGTEPLKNKGGSLVLETEQDYARPFPRGCSGDLAEIKVEGDYDSAFCLRLCEDVRVRHPLQALIAEMRRIVAVFAQPDNYPAVHVHVSEEAHDLGGDQLLLCQPGCVFDGLLDIFALEIRVSFKDLLETGAVRDLANDKRHCNPHAADAGASAHDLRIESDAAEHSELIVARNCPTGFLLIGESAPCLSR
jgi:hypothetical protein